MDNKTHTLKKIKIDSKENVELIFEERVTVAPEGDEEASREIRNVYVATCQHKPHKDLLEAVLGLRKYALEICEFPSDAPTRNQFTVASMVISGDMELQNSRVMFSLSKWIKSRGKTVNIATPQTMMFGDEYAKAAEMTKQIEKVIQEAWLYLSGKNGEKIQLAFNFPVMKKAA